MLRRLALGCLSQPGLVHRQVVALSLTFEMTDPQQIRSALKTLADTPREGFGEAGSLVDDLTSSDTEERQRRTICVRFYLTSEEEGRLNQRTDGVKNRSRWLRSRVFGLAPPRSRPSIPEVNRTTFITVKRMGSEVNQIAKALNIALARKQELPLSQECLNILRDIHASLDAVGRELVKLNALPELEGEDEI